MMEPKAPLPKIGLLYKVGVWLAILSVVAHMIDTTTDTYVYEQGWQPILPWWAEMVILNIGSIGVILILRGLLSWKVSVMTWMAERHDQ